MRGSRSTSAGSKRVEIPPGPGPGLQRPAGGLPGPPGLCWAAMHRRPRPATLLLALLLPLACAGPGPGTGACEAVSLLGEPLLAPRLAEAVLRERTARLSEARAALAAEPTEKNLVWVGRHLAYLGRYREAVEAYSEGLARFPASYRLRRHRGHRYLTLRRLDEALADLSVAAHLVEGVPDEVEPDGLPNARGIPRGTTNGNIYYHLGLVQYLQADHEASRAAFERCLGFATNDDMQCAARYWLFLNLRRLGRVDEARAVLEPVSPDMEIFENFGYRDLLLLFKGQRTPAEVTSAEGDAIADATLAYGVSMWHELEGRPAEARRLREELVAGDSWAAFGFLAAEADLAR